jgi:hypothetical protein
MLLGVTPAEAQSLRTPLTTRRLGQGSRVRLLIESPGERGPPQDGFPRHSTWSGARCILGDSGRLINPINALREKLCGKWLIWPLVDHRISAPSR